MLIKNIVLKNFKFHHDLEIKFENKNCLIYGENGSGKSSIYEALYSNFYYYKNKNIANNIFKIRDTFFHRDFPEEEVEVNIIFNNEISLNRKDDNLDNSDILLESQGHNINVYFANEKVLRHITSDNFFNVINDELVNHFHKLSSFTSCYNEVKKSLSLLDINEPINPEIIKLREEADEVCNNKLHELISTDKINTILEHNLQCNFKIEYTFVNSYIDLDKKFHKPFISFKIIDIDDRNDFKNHFNEAVFKLISIAVFFVLVKNDEAQNQLKLLVLDDFLTSLDMANRKKIARFIIDNFEMYQIIILTHNIQFNNLLKKLIDKTKWDIKFLFTIKEDDSVVAKIKDKNDDLIEEAKIFIHTYNYDLAIAGNLLRKAFECIINEFEQLLELGKVETLQKVLEALKNDDSYFYDTPHEILETLIKDFENMFQNTQQPADAKIRQIQNKINAIKNNKITFKIEDGTEKSYHLLKRTEFYKNILMNPSSHNDSETEIYKEECENTIFLLEELNKLLEKLKEN